MAFEEGNGSRVLFWKDKWCGSMALCDAFPNLFVVVAHKDVVIKEMWSLDERGGCWNPHFLRPFNNWELEEVKNFRTFLSRTKVQPGASYVKRRRKRLTTCLFIVREPRCYGILSWQLLILIGCSPVRFVNVSLLGKAPVSAKNGRKFGWRLLSVYSGRCGWKGTG